jgi:hypothetical protein
LDQTVDTLLQSSTRPAGLPVEANNKEIHHQEPRRRDDRQAGKACHAPAAILIMAPNLPRTKIERAECQTSAGPRPEIGNQAASRPPTIAGLTLTRPGASARARPAARRGRTSEAVRFSHPVGQAPKHEPQSSVSVRIRNRRRTDVTAGGSRLIRPAGRPTYRRQARRFSSSSVSPGRIFSQRNNAHQRPTILLLTAVSAQPVSSNSRATAIVV